MQIIIKGRHTVVPKRLRAFATTKFERLERFLDRIQTIEIAVGESAARKVTDKSFVEVTLVTNLRRVHAEAHGPDIMTAVEAAVAKVEAQVKRLKGKAIARTRRGGGHVLADQLAATAALNGAADAPVRIATKAGVRARASKAAASSNGKRPAAASKARSTAKAGTARTAAAKKPRTATTARSSKTAKPARAAKPASSGAKRTAAATARRSTSGRTKSATSGRR